MTIDSKLFKHYLPYEMPVIGFPYAHLPEKMRHRVTGKMVGLRDDFCYVHFQDENGYKWDGVQQIIFADVVPLLRPLEYLVKPCLDGTVPLVELCKFYCDEKIKVHRCEEVEHYKEERRYRLEFTKDSKHGLFDFEYKAHKMVFTTGDYGGNHGGSDYTCSFQLQLFEKLFAMHFDVFGMIKEGFAQSLYEEKNKNILPFLSCAIDR